METTLDMGPRLVRLPASERGVLVAPDELRRRGYVAHALQPLPRRAACIQVGAVVVETRGQAARPRHRAYEYFDHSLRPRVWIRADPVHRPQPLAVLVRQHPLRLAGLDEQPDVGLACLLVCVLAAGCRE